MNDVVAAFMLTVWRGEIASELRLKSQTGRSLNPSSGTNDLKSQNFRFFDFKREIMLALCGVEVRIK